MEFISININKIIAGQNLSLSCYYFLDVYSIKFHFIFPPYQYYFVPLHK